MKNFSKYLFLFLLSSIVVFTSCNNDDEDLDPNALSLVLEGDDISDDSYRGFVGDTLEFTVRANAPEGINVMRINKSVGGAAGTLYETVASTDFTQSTTDANVYEYEFEYKLPENEAGENVVFTFEVVDEEGQSSSKNFTLDIVPVKLYTAVLLAAPLGNSTSETFFSTNTGETFSVGQINASQASISPNVDFGYFYGEDFGATLASPANYPIAYGQANWTKRNDTKLKMTNITAEDFIERNDDLDFITDAFDNSQFGLNQGQVRDLEVGDVITFETDPSKTGGSKRGLIRVVDIEGTTGENDYIEIEVLVEI